MKRPPAYADGLSPTLVAAGLLTRRGRRETDLQKIDQRRQIGDIYAPIPRAIDIRFLGTAKRCERNIKIVDQGRQVGDVHRVGRVTIDIAVRRERNATSSVTDWLSAGQSTTLSHCCDSSLNGGSESAGFFIVNLNRE